ncbi:MAG TPA: universal stress protein [Gaiellaceae bacterium]|nr:universal stress protein [Gaiellaceae bacterium]
MDSRPVLICYDGSTHSERAIGEAAALFAPRHAVVLTVGPIMTFAESLTATSSVVPGNAYDDLNKADAMQSAELGAEHARRAGLTAEARVELSADTWYGILTVADDIDAAAIVIGSHGVKSLRDRARGGVSRDVATHARRPVLIVPPAADS